MSQDSTNATVKLLSSDEVTITSDDVKVVGRSLKNDRITPMIAQYLGIKKENPNSLLFYRMGDFYELFFEDAVKAAAVLDIALTKRGRYLDKDIPMCGVPVHSHAAYLHRLIRHGFRVAICEQMEDPEQAKKRGSKAVVQREVVRIVTPGTLTEETLLDARRHNYLAAVAQAAGKLGLAWVDVSTGILNTQPLAEADLETSLARIEPGELVISETLLENPIFKKFRSLCGERLSPQPQGHFDSSVGRKRLETIYGVSTLDGFGDFSRAEIAAAGGIVEYVQLTQKGKLPRFSAPIRHTAADIMEIDSATRRNLELVRTLAGEKQGALLSVIDKTVTGAGARTLADRLSQPLTDPQRISRRLDAVQCFVEDSDARADLRKILSEAPDIVRALSRLTLGRGGPRDLASVRDGLVAAENIGARIVSSPVISLPDNVAAARSNLTGHKACIDRLNNALADDLPLLVREGGFIRMGYNADLDELVALRDKSRQHVASLQAKYVSETELSGLKIKHNNVIGYFVELPIKQAERLTMATDSPFIHRQTMANAMRFSTIELAELEGQIFTAAERAQALELAIFEDLVSEVCVDAGKIASCADALAKIDVITALADLAITRRYVRPDVDSSYAFEVRGGRHPVVEFALEQAMEGPFVANDCVLDTSEGAENGDRLWLLTGPNMAGKSTFLRQNALISIMAQMGSFVPAASARVGIIDRLFSRVGASDDLAQGRSTFMVEMVETATILNQAGPRALVILDEIGRGTATYDGLSIAWAVVEHLHESNRCRALFATHYHELTALADRLDALRCQTMKVKEWNDDVIFLHQVEAGTADRSYGIHVGKLAGLPKPVVARAEVVLKTLETDQYGTGLQKLSEGLPLFQALQDLGSQPVDSKPSDIESAIDVIVPDEMSPRAALEFVYKIKKIREEN